MNTDKIKQVLSLLSAERVNTSGLGAPINILKRLVEDMEVETMGNTEQQKPDVEDIIDIINNNFKEFKGTNEAILHAAEEIIDLLTQKVESEEVKQIEPEFQNILNEATFANMKDKPSKDRFESEVNSLSAEQYIRRLYPLSDKFSRLGCEKIAESFASMRVEQAKKEWEQEKFEYAASQVAIAIQTILSKLCKLSN